MVTFVSVFLWLVVGVQTVEVAVDAQVAWVEILLDGAPVASMTDPRWKARVDFGSNLAPRQLTAVAYGETGDEIGKTHQIVNLPRPPAVAKIVLDHDDDGRPVSAKIITESADRTSPVNVIVSLDGRVLAPSQRHRYPLPPVEAGSTHVLSAEASWSHGITARSDLSLGASYGGIVTTELTALPIRTRGTPPTADQLQGRLTIDGDALRVAAVERSGARIFVVRDLASTSTLMLIGMSHQRPSRSVRAKHDVIFEHDLAPEIDRLHLVGVNAAASRKISLFPVAGPVSLKRWSLPWAVANLHDRYPDPDEQRLADAVAVAGIRAAGHGNPRAVVLIVSDNPIDGSGYSVEAVIHYLGTLGVPLAVWTTGKETTTTWGAAIRVTRSKDLNRATKTLMSRLDDQWIVWVEGLHLVNRIDLDGTDLGVEIVGRGGHLTKDSG